MNICWRLARLLWALCALACFQLPLAYAATLDCPAPPSGTAPMQLPAGGFGMDGDVQANTPGIGIGDWVPDPTGSGGAVLTSAGVPLDPTTTFHLIDAYGGIDTNFKSGLKVDDDPNTWSWIINPTTAKDDLNNALIHVSADSSGHRWLVLSADRAINNGDSYIDFEFLQRPLSLTTNADGISGGFTSAGPQGGRTTNDFLLTMTFTKGGTAAAVCVSRWQPSGSGFDYVDATAALPPGSIFGAVNTSIIPVPYGAFGINTYDVNTFAEVAVDVTVLLGGFDPCLSVGVKTIMVKTKTSQSPQATIVDFIAPLSLDLRLGPGVDAGTDQAKCTEGASTTFTLNGAAYPGVDPIVSTNWSVVSGSATIDSPNSLTSAAHVSSTSATLRLTMVDRNGCTKSDDVVLSVNPLPPCSITGPEFVFASNNSYSGPDGMDAYSWSISGNGTISGPTSSQSVGVIAGSACGQKFTLTLKVTKNGCSSTCSQSFSVPDTTPPVIGDAGADSTIECPNTPVFTPPTATDACDPNARIVEVSDVTTPGACAGSYTRTKTWKAVDADGNESGTKSQSISVRDNTAPVISDAGANATIDCPNTPVFTPPTATDACDSNPRIVEVSDVTTPGVLAGSYTRTKTWKAVDACGNQSGIKSQAITVRDNTAPVISDAGANATIDCSSAPVFTAPTATDTCDPNPRIVEVSDVTTPGTCTGSYTRTKTWQAVDAASNESGMKSQTITVRDTTAPVISAPGANATIDCPSTPVFTPPTATDACDPNPRIVEVSDVTTPGNCSGSYARTKTWKAVDACGNESGTQSQTITVRDTTAPVISDAGAEATIDCPNTPVFTPPTAIDACDPNPRIVEVSDVTTPGALAGSYKRTKTWKAVDACGNKSVTRSQSITVRDNTAPVIGDAGANATIDCPNTPVFTPPTATDACDANPRIVEVSDVTTPGNCPGSYTRTKIWKAVDAGGNESATRSQTITVTDSTAPVITCPARRTVGSNDSIDPSVTGSATAVDNCDPAPKISYTDNTAPGNCPNTMVIARTWTAIDSCGNSSSCVQSITVSDTPPPVIVCPPTATVQCNTSTDPSVTGQTTATVSSGPNPTLSYSDSLAPGNCPNTMVITRHWKATDCAGKYSQCDQIINVVDTTAPVISTCPANKTVDCNTSTDPSATGIATATDNCDPKPTINYSDEVTGTCTKVIIRTWTATDCAGNQSQCVQTITVTDTVAPDLTCPPDKTVEEYAPTDPNVTGRATAVDNCDPAPAISYSDVTSGASTRIITRTWSATDCAGNQSRCVQTITVVDSSDEGTLITDSEGCTLLNNRFRLILTPDLRNVPCYKLNASNPGQFFYNVFYSATPGSSATFHVTLPYPFVTQGARPIGVYDGVTVHTSGSQTCLVPGNKIVAGPQKVTLSNYGSNPVMGVTTYTLNVTVTVPDTGFVFLAIHLDYGLKITSGYGRNTVGDATACANTAAILVPNHQPYTFSVDGAASGSATVSSYNSFQGDPVVRGLGQSQITTFSVPGATAVLKNAKGTVLDSEISDQDGRCIFNYKYASKAATFYVTLTPPAGFGTAQTKAITLKPNGDVEVDFTTP